MYELVGIRMDLHITYKGFDKAPRNGTVVYLLQRRLEDETRHVIEYAPGHTLVINENIRQALKRAYDESISTRRQFAAARFSLLRSMLVSFYWVNSFSKRMEMSVIDVHKIVLSLHVESFRLAEKNLVNKAKAMFPEFEDRGTKANIEDIYSEVPYPHIFVPMTNVLRIADEQLIDKWEPETASQSDFI